MNVRLWAICLTAVTLGTLALTSCRERDRSPITSAEKANALEAVAILSPTAGNNVDGVVTFIETPEGVRIVAEVVGLTQGEHGFHIHEKGDCSAPDASSAGGHFNPTSKSHGAPDSVDRHVGDLGNITADRSGIARMDRLDRTISLRGENSVIGKAVVVHSQADDFTTQPTGNAGGRMGCGVIKLKE